MHTIEKGANGSLPSKIGGQTLQRSFSSSRHQLFQELQLKLAAAILSEPRLLVLSPLFDTVPRPRLNAVFEHFRDLPTSILYFSNRPEDVVLDGWLWLGLEEQRLVRDMREFDALRSQAGRETVDGD